MTRTFSRYVVSVVLVAAVAIALWGIGSAMYAQQGDAAATLAAPSDADNGRRLGLAMLNYAEAHGKFPPAACYGSDGKPLLSWRVLILPYLGEYERKLYSRFHLDEPWDSPANKPLSKQIPAVFAPHGEDLFSSPDTFWQAFCGEKTIFADAQGMPFSDIQDGLSNTILLVESNTAVPWTKPADLSFDSLSPTTHQGLNVPRGFRVVMADGSVRRVPPLFPIDKLKELLTREGNEHADASALVQFEPQAAERVANDPNVQRQLSPEEFIQSFRGDDISRGGANNYPYYLKNQKAPALVEALQKMYPHLKLYGDKALNSVVLVEGTPAMNARMREFIEYSELSPEEKAKRGLSKSVREFIQGEALEMMAGAATPAVAMRDRMGRSAGPGPSLEQQVRQEFDARQATLRQQIKDFSERLQRLTVLVDERDRAKEAIIQRRVDELRNPNLRWEAANQAASGGDRSPPPTANLEATTKFEVQTFRLRHIQPDTVVKALLENFRSSAGIQFSQTPDSIKVAAIPDEMVQLRALIRELDAPPPADDAASTPIAELDGLWEVNYPQEIADKTAVESRTRVVFYKNLYGTFTGNVLRTASTFSNLQGTSPMRLAIYGDKPMRGIYEVKDDGLRLNMAPIDAAFPTEFATEKPEFRRINKAVPQEMLDAITSHIQDAYWSKRAGNRLSEPANNPFGGADPMAPERETSPPRQAPANANDPFGALLLRSANEFQADLAWARWNVARTKKALDQRLAEIRKTKPDAGEQDVVEIDEAKSDAWEGAKHRLDSLRNELASQLKLIDASLEKCRQEIVIQKERLSQMENVLTPKNKLLERQREVVQNAELRLKQIIALRVLYQNVSEFPSTWVVPSGIALPSPAEIEGDLRRKIGLHLSPATLKLGEGEEEQKGLRVLAVRADSPAAKAGLQENDFVVAAHIWNIASLDNLWYALSQVGSTRADQAPEEIKVWVWRGGQFLSVRLPPIRREG